MQNQTSISKSHDDERSFQLFQNQVNSTINKRNTRYVVESQDGDELEKMDSVYELDDCKSYRHLMVRTTATSASTDFKNLEQFQETQVIDDFESEQSDQMT